MCVFIVHPYETDPGVLNREYLAEVVRIVSRPSSLKRGVAVGLLHTI